MPSFTRNITAAIASVMIVATTLYQVVTVPPVQAASAMVVPILA